MARQAAPRRGTTEHHQGVDRKDCVPWAVPGDPSFEERVRGRARLRMSRDGGHRCGRAGSPELVIALAVWAGHVRQQLDTQ